MNMEHTKRVAIKKSGISGWEPYKFAAIGSDAIALTGGIPRLLKSGKRKGQRTWDEKGTTEIVTDEESLVELDRYEANTGICGDCLGEGKVIDRWSIADGKGYRPCQRCDGSGVPPP